MLKTLTDYIIEKSQYYDEDEDYIEFEVSRPHYCLWTLYENNLIITFIENAPFSRFHDVNYRYELKFNLKDNPFFEVNFDTNNLDKKALDELFIKLKDVKEFTSFIEMIILNKDLSSKENIKTKRDKI